MARQREVEQWITVNGVHVPVFKGESKADAAKNFKEKVGKHNAKQPITQKGKANAKKEYTNARNAAHNASADKKEKADARFDKAKQKYTEAELKNVPPEMRKKLERQQAANRANEKFIDSQASKLKEHGYFYMFNDEIQGDKLEFQKLLNSKGLEVVDNDQQGNFKIGKAKGEQTETQKQLAKDFDKKEKADARFDKAKQRYTEAKEKKVIKSATRTGDKAQRSGVYKEQLKDVQDDIKQFESTPERLRSADYDKKLAELKKKEASLKGYIDRDKPTQAVAKTSTDNVTAARTHQDLTDKLSKNGLKLDAADAHTMENSNSLNGEKVTMYDKDGNEYRGTYNKYSDGGREIVNIKKTADSPRKIANDNEDLKEQQIARNKTEASRSQQSERAENYKALIEKYQKQGIVVRRS